MQRADLPTRFPIPFADAAVPPYVHEVPEASQISVTAGAASLTDGFVPLNFTPISAGGVPPFGDDINGILKQITQWSQWQAAAGPVTYNSSFATSINGYPKGATVSSETYEGYLWLCTVDDTATDPDGGSPDAPLAGWSPVSLLGGSATTGDWKWRPTAEDLPGWVKANGGTLSKAGSGGTLLASAQAAALYIWFYVNFADAICPVSGGRSGSGRAAAATDFAAGKTIAVLSMRGTGIVGMDTMGGGATTNLTGVPVTNGSATAAGSLLGENLHSLTANENGPHVHGYNNPQNGGGSAASGGSVGGPSSTGSSGLGTAHNTVALSVTGSMYWKL